MQHSFTIEAVPVPASRPKVTRTGMAFYPARHVAYKNFLAEELKKHLFKVDGPLAVRIMFVENAPKVSKFPTSQSDVDNLVKLPLDSMTSAGFWPDDRLIVSLVVTKRYCREGEQPHTKFIIEEIDEEYNDFVDRMFKGE